MKKELIVLVIIAVAIIGVAGAANYITQKSRLGSTTSAAQSTAAQVSLRPTSTPM